jgi:hypothetical protein
MQIEAGPGGVPRGLGARSRQRLAERPRLRRSAGAYSLMIWLLRREVVVRLLERLWQGW